MSFTLFFIAVAVLGIFVGPLVIVLFAVGGIVAVYTGTPLQPGETGVRTFCADSSGRLASTTDGAVSMVVDGLCVQGTTTLVARTVAP